MASQGHPSMAGPIYPPSAASVNVQSGCRKPNSTTNKRIGQQMPLNAIDAWYYAYENIFTLNLYDNVGLKVIDALPNVDEQFSLDLHRIRWFSLDFHTNWYSTDFPRNFGTYCDQFQVDMQCHCIST